MRLGIWALLLITLVSFRTQAASTSCEALFIPELRPQVPPPDLEAIKPEAWFERMGAVAKRITATGRPEYMGIERDLSRSYLANALMNHKTMLYPASGFDLATGFLLARNANRVIGIDAFPFTADASSDTFDLRGRTVAGIRPPHVQWVNKDVVASAHTLAPQLVMALYAAFPDARLHDVIAFSLNGASHGVIRFDLGPGTATREYLHLQAHLQQQDTKRVPTLISDMMSTYLPDSILFKASMAITGWYSIHLPIARFSMNENFLQQREMSKQSMGYLLAAMVVARGGVIVESDARKWERVLPVKRVLETTMDLGYEEAVLFYREPVEPKQP